jgi:hypothetical protein
MDIRIAVDVIEGSRIVATTSFRQTNLRGQIPAAIRGTGDLARRRATSQRGNARDHHSPSRRWNAGLSRERQRGHRADRQPPAVKETCERRCAPFARTLGDLRWEEGEIALFEAARVYLSRGQELPEELEHVAGVVGGRREDRWGHATEEPVDFYDAKGYLEQLLHGLGVEASLEAAEEFGMLPGRVAEVRVEGEKVGVIGQAHPRAAAAFDIESDAYLFEVILDKLLPFAGKHRRYEPVSRFPPIVQDISLTVDEGVPAARIESIINKAPLVRRVRLFDVYGGEQVGAGKKSLAFSITYQSPDHTLTDEEVARRARHRRALKRKWARSCS